MKKIYSFALLLLLSFSFFNCSKDFLKPYEDRIIGSWRISDIDSRGWGSSRNLPFREGIFAFAEDGKLTYTNAAGRIYSGSWDIRKEYNRGNCQTDDNGNRQCDDKRVQKMQLTAVDFAAQEIKTEYFDDIDFTNTNRMKAYIYSGSRTYVYYFIRM